MRKKKQTSKSDSAVYFVERVLDENVTDDGEKIVLVKWEGYDDLTWEPEAQMPSAVLQVFKQEQISAKSSPNKVKKQKQDTPTKRRKSNSIVLQSVTKKKKSSVSEQEEKDLIKWSANDQFEVESILNSKTVKRKLFYLVKWRGWKHSANSWEEESCLDGCPQVVAAFKRTHDSFSNGVPNRKRSSPSAPTSPKRRRGKVAASLSFKKKRGRANNR